MRATRILAAVGAVAGWSAHDGGVCYHEHLARSTTNPFTHPPQPLLTDVAPADDPLTS
jgi:hypothetical protein